MYDDDEEERRTDKLFYESFRQQFYKEHEKYDPNIKLEDQTKQVQNQVASRTMDWLGC